MELKIQISNEEFSNLITEATEAHLKTLARGIVDKYIHDAVKQKLTNMNIDKMAETATRDYITQSLYNKIGLAYYDNSAPKEWFSNIIKETVNECVPKYVKTTAIKKKIDLEVNKKVKNLIDQLSKQK
jgi:DNA-binding FrmR family transcriptional regulator